MQRARAEQANRQIFHSPKQSTHWATRHRGSAWTQHNWFPVLSLRSPTLFVQAKTNNGCSATIYTMQIHTHTSTTLHRLIFAAFFHTNCSTSTAGIACTSPEKFIRVPTTESTWRKRIHVNANVSDTFRTQMRLCAGASQTFPSSTWLTLGAARHCHFRNAFSFCVTSTLSAHTNPQHSAHIHGTNYAPIVYSWYLIQILIYAKSTRRHRIVRHSSFLIAIFWLCML